VFRRDRLVKHVMQKVWGERKRELNNQRLEDFAAATLKTQLEMEEKIKQRRAALGD
jgi:hypothetical protein